MASRALILGAGKFARGGIVPALKAAGIEPLLSNRAESASADRLDRIRARGGYDLLTHSLGTDSIETIECRVLCWRDDRAELNQLAASPDTELIITSLKDGQAPSIPLVRELLETRAAANVGVPLFILPMENSLNKELAECVRAFINSDVHLIRCVVDRLCLDARSPADAIRVEKDMSWVLERASKQQVDERLSSLLGPLVENGVASFVDHIRPHMARKVWLVNGAHVIASVQAMMADMPGIHHYLQSRMADAFLEAQKELSIALSLSYSRTFTSADAEAFSSDVARRFASFEDYADRILGRLFEGNAWGYYTDLFEKLVRPAEVYLVHEGHPPQRLTEAIYNSIRIMQDIEKYLR